MENFDDLYKKIGVNKIAHMVEPRVLLAEEFVFPKNSILFWTSVNDIQEFFTTSIPYCTNIKKGLALTVSEYDGQYLLGKFTHKPSSLNKLISINNKKEKIIKFIKHNKKKLKLSDTSLLVYNTGILNKLYKYSHNPMNKYYKWNNVMSTVFEDVKYKNLKTSRNIFINIDIPITLPSFEELERYRKVLRVNDLDELSRYRHFNIIELWRLLSPELENSLIRNTLPLTINDFPNTDYDRLNLILSLDNKIIILNLKLLLSIVKEYEIGGKLTKYPSLTVRKILYVMLNKFIHSVGYSALELESNINMNSIHHNVTETTIVDDVDIGSMNIDDTIKNELEPTKKLNPDDVTDVVDDNSDEDLIADAISGVELTHIEEEEVKFNSVEEILNYEPNPSEELIKDLHEAKENKLISKKELERLTMIVAGKDKIPSPYPEDNRTVAEILDTSKDDIELSEDELKLPDSPSVIDKTMNKDVINVINKKYIGKQYKKDLVRTLYSLENSKTVIENYTVDVHEDILGGTETHVMRVKPFKGSPSNIKVILPKIEENGTFKISKNTYRLKPQKADLPLRKIGYNEISLSTYYGKLFITKSIYKNEDAGFWFLKQLLKLRDDNKSISNLISLPAINKDVDAPQDYLVIARYVTSFNHKGITYNFQYNNRDIICKEPEKYEKNGSVVIGSNKTFIYVINKDNTITKYKDGKEVENLGKIYDILEIPEHKKPMEFCNIRIFSEVLPLGIVLTYYLGFNSLLKLLKSEFEVFPSNKRVSANGDEYIIQFQDKKYLIKKKYDFSDMILGGLVKLKKITKTINNKVFNSRNQFEVVFHRMGLSLLISNEIKLIENMYLDPISKDLLGRMHEPKNLIGLFIRCAEILQDDKYKNPANIKGMVIKGHERISGMLYNELIRSLREHENKSYFGRSRIVFNPYSIIKKITEDSGTELVNDTNPIALLKGAEEVTSLGFGGRSKETMSKETRVADKSVIGIESEAAKDSGDVGIVNQLSAAPKITSIRGEVGVYDPNKDHSVNIYSTVANLTPFGNKDDVKRLVFSNIQASHVVPIKNMRAPYIRTGYEGVVALRVDEKFVVSAKYDGVVNSVSKDKINVTYYLDNKKTKKQDYILKEWTTKEESGSCYLHKLVPNVIKGQKFKAGTSLIYDEMFFEPDLFDKSRVIYKTAANVNVMLSEDPQTFEDSCAISKEVHDKLGTEVVKVKSFIIKKDTNIMKPMSVGDKVDVNDILFTMLDGSVGDIENLDERSLKILQDLKSSSPKAKVKGTIKKVVVYYNCELNEMSRSLKKLVRVSDEELIKNEGYPGRVNSSYSVEGKPLQEGEIQIKYYIVTSESMGIGDKAILGNQLKFTVGEVFDYKMQTKNGTNIDMVFSNLSISARIVNSPYLIGTTSMILENITNQAVDMYFGKV